MQVAQFHNPRDWTYPFAQSLYDDPCTVYHGTSSAYASTIEANGFARGQLPFSVPTLQRLISLADEIGFRSWSYTTVKGLSSGIQLSADSDRPIYFSANFWFARDYATSIGGETIHNAILLTEELLDHIESTADGNSAMSNTVRQIHSHLRSLTANSFLIVYAVRVQPEWLQHEYALERQEIGTLVVTEVNIACLRTVPSDRLMAKVEYINGAESGYLGPQPATWLEARQLGQF